MDMENKFALIRWEMTQNIDYVDLEDLKCFSVDNSAPRKQKSTDFYPPPSGKKIASTEQCQNYRSDLQRCTKKCSIQRRTLLSCVLKVRLGT
jgi:hypothetical protein